MDSLKSEVEVESILEENKYVLIGTDEAELSVLTDIPSPTNLKSIHLKFVEIDPEILMHSLKNCPNLEILELIDVDFTFTVADISASFRINLELRNSITLPKLKSYKLRTGLNTEVGDYNRKEIFSAWIPFSIPGAVEDIVKLPLDLDFFGRDDGMIFQINHAKGEIQSRLRWTNDVLKNIRPDFICKKLVIFFCYAELDARIIPRSLTHLELTGTVFKHGTLADVLKKTSLLQTLYLDGVHNDRRSDDPGQLSLVDLGHLSDLTALWLDHMVLSYSSNLQLPNLRELVLDTRMENIDSQIIHNFENVFPNIEKVALVMHNQLVNSLLEKILHLKSIKNIFLKTNYIRENRSVWNTIESEQLKSILLEINQEDDQYFTLKRDPVANNWSGSPVDAYGPFLKDFLTAPFVAFWD